MARVIHFEIPADKPERAVAFYGKVFDWKIEKFQGGGEYWLVMTGRQGEPGIDGGIMDRSGCKTTVNTVGVADLEEFVKKVIAAGGKRATPSQSIPGVGMFCYCMDPEGNWFGLLQPEMPG